MLRYWLFSLPSGWGGAGGWWYGVVDGGKSLGVCVGYLPFASPETFSPLSSPLCSVS